jgi:4-carboxymuconolactone decarboxylase
MNDKLERAALGVATFQEVIGLPVQTLGGTPLMDASRDFIFAEVWSRPGLDKRSRRWITLSAVCAAGEDVPIRTYLKAALDSGEITEAELREFFLQFAVFQGFPKAVKAELLLNQILAEAAQT